jgi:class 3 adenylate cyclase
VEDRDVRCTCGRENRSDARFCDTCAAPLQPAVATPGERRQLTALFCDLVDYSRLSHLIDEEDLHRIVQAYQLEVSRVLTRWDGHVESYVADGINAYFGYPHAHEDDAERAVRAALEILHTVAALNLDVMADAARPLPPLAVRIGIHTGIVVIGNVGAGEHGKRQALGVAMNVAARLQRVAAPQSVVMSQATERLVSGMFVSRDLGTPTLKGIDTPIRAFAVLGSTGVHARHVTSTAAMVGREGPLRQLYASWQRARAGHGHSVLVAGDAGIGKSRLVRRFIERLEQEGSGRGFEWRCSRSTPARRFIP